MNQNDPLRFIFAAAAVIVIIAGLRTASSIVVPFLLSVFLAAVSAPALFWMRRNRVPEGLSLFLVIIMIIGSLPLLGLFLGNSLESFTEALPRYQDKLKVLVAVAADWLEGHGLVVSRATFRQAFAPGTAMDLANQVLNGLQGILRNVFLIILTVIFILMEAGSFPHKLQALAGPDGEVLRQYARLMESVKKYVAVNTVISLMTAVSVGIMLLLIGVDFPVLWATLAFFLNYIPTVGSLIAAIPALLLALVQLGPTAAVITACGYLAINTVFGNVVEPRVMGRSVGLSPLVVFLSLVFWGWVLGPVGMILSVPLTMRVKLALEGRAETRGLGLMLGADPAVQNEIGPGPTAEKGKGA